MTSHLAGKALVRVETDRDWTITCVEYPHGVVRLERRHGVTQVVVGERDDAGADEPVSFAAAGLTDAGDLLVAVRAAPPAIVVGPDGCRTRPVDGSGSDFAPARPGERLVLLSCSAFDRVPELLVGGLPDPHTCAAEDVLRMLLGASGCGAGAVIDYHPSGRSGLDAAVVVEGGVGGQDGNPDDGGPRALGRHHQVDPGAGRLG